MSSDDEVQQRARAKIADDEDEEQIRNDDDNENSSEGEGDRLDVEDDDNSSEEEDDDEDEMQKVREGFIVDDEDDDEDEDEDVGSTKRKHKKKRRRDREDGDGGSRSARNRSDEELDQDDLDFLLEMNGQQSGRGDDSGQKFKRLKRAETANDAEQRGRGLTDLFSDEEEDDSRPEASGRRAGGAGRYQDEMDDFIEEDEFSDEERQREEEREIRGGRRTGPHGESSRGGSRGPGGTGALNPELLGIDEDKLGEIFEIFGDGEEYQWAIDAEEDEEYAQLEEQGEEELKDIFEPGELEARYLTENDNKIRTQDIPERFQLLRSVLKFDYQLTDEDYNQEIEWVSSKLLLSSDAGKKITGIESNAHLRPLFTKCVAKALEFVSKDQTEVPVIWTHRKDYLIIQKSTDGPSSDLMLDENDLWNLVYLDIEFHGIIEKRDSTRRLYDSIAIPDMQYEEIVQDSSSLLDFQDLMDYLQFTYSAKMRDQTKRHSRFARFERIKNSSIFNVLTGFGLSTEKLAENVATQTRLYYADDPSFTPLEYTQKIIDTAKEERPEDAINSYSPTQALELAEMYFAEELYHNPKVRRTFRKYFLEKGVVNIVLTDKGEKIDEASPYYDFKFAINRTFDELKLHSPELFLRMLKAEQEGLVGVRIQYPDYKTTLFEEILQLFTSDNVSDVATQWNDVRRRVFKEASRKLVPLITRNIKEDLRIHCEKVLFFDVRQKFIRKLNRAPYKPKEYVAGTTPRALIVSGGNCNFSRDAVLAVVIDENGEVVRNGKYGDPRQPAFVEALSQLVSDEAPDVIGISGYNVNSTRLFHLVNGIVRDKGLLAAGTNDLIEVLWIQDETARLYQQSSRALQEFSDQPTLQRYCVGLGRYVQSPLLEYAALDESEVSSLLIHPHQNLLSKESFQQCLESCFVDITCTVGVDLNDAVNSSYYANLVPYIAGMGPRKAPALLQQLQQIGNPLQNRSELVTEGLTASKVFFNCASFVKIPYNSNRTLREEVEILDATRIHPEDYELARKMAADAIDADEEDIASYESTGGVVAQLLQEDPEKQLNELLLDDYAQQIEKNFGQKKRETLDLIKDELIQNYYEKRPPFEKITNKEVFTMLSGESPETLHTDTITAASVVRVFDKALACRLPCGVDARVESRYLGGGNNYNDRHSSARSMYSSGQTVQGVVMNIDYERFQVELSLVPGDITRARERLRSQAAPRDRTKWNFKAEEALRRDMSKVSLQDGTEIGDVDLRKKGRIIKHPLFKLFESHIQAEAYLADKQRGEAVIRPSSRGYDHIAITWKVTDGVYQHLDVVEVERNGKKELEVGKQFYSDLDELLIMHVQSMSTKVDEMISSEKFQKGTKADVEKWLTVYLDANPMRSTYAFCFDYKRAGYFYLCFKLNQRSPVQFWHVKVIPNGYELATHVYADVRSLSNGFKLMLMSQQSQVRRR